jgi:hypothetical protein
MALTHIDFASGLRALADDGGWRRRVPSNFESEGRGFESLRARQRNKIVMQISSADCFPEIMAGKHMGSKAKNRVSRRQF